MVMVTHTTIHGHGIMDIRRGAPIRIMAGDILTTTTVTTVTRRLLLLIMQPIAVRSMANVVREAASQVQTLTGLSVPLPATLEQPRMATDRQSPEEVQLHHARNRITTTVPGDIRHSKTIRVARRRMEIRITTAEAAIQGLHGKATSVVPGAGDRIITPAVAQEVMTQVEAVAEAPLQGVTMEAGRAQVPDLRVGVINEYLLFS